MHPQQLGVPVPREPPGRVREDRGPRPQILRDGWLEPDERVLDGRRRHRVDPGVHALHVSLQHRARGLRPPRDLGSADPVEPDDAREAVLRERGRGEELGEPSARGPQGEVDLEQPLGRGDEPLREPQVLERGRADVQDAPPIAPNLYGIR